MGAILRGAGLDYSHGNANICNT